MHTGCKPGKRAKMASIVAVFVLVNTLRGGATVEQREGRLFSSGDQIW